MTISDDRLFALLNEMEFIPIEELQTAFESAKSINVSLQTWLLSHDMLSIENLGQLIANEYKLPYVHLSQMGIDDHVLKLIPEKTANEHRVIAFDLSDDELKIATSNPDDKQMLQQITKHSHAKHVKLFYASDIDIEEALNLYKENLKTLFEKLIKGSDGQTISVAGIVETVVDHAFNNKVSDVHIEPSRTTSNIRFRIDGVLHDVSQLPMELHDQITARVKVLSSLRTDLHHSAQDGRMHLQVDDHEVDIRVSIVPITAGEKIVLRILSSHNRQFSLIDLGMSEADLEKVKNGFQRPYGMVLSTGPTGSGKTTTMYAILRILNTREKNIATIEDPVEYEVEGLNQIQVNAKADLTFAKGLRSILRQDPDIIYVGEIRDEETADIAINSAMTGHLVLSTLHTNDAATTLPRLIDMDTEPFLVASTVNVIVAQRLVRRICTQCKVSLEIERTEHGWSGDEKSCTMLNMIPRDHIDAYFDNSDSHVRIYAGKGCLVCHGTGYIGRIGLFEVMNISPAIHELIKQKASADDITRKAIEEGMIPMMKDGLSKVQQGVTTLEEVLRATHA